MESRNNTERCNESDDDSTLLKLISEAETDTMSSGDESDAGPMSIDILEDICDRSQSRLSKNRIETHYNIRYRIKQRLEEWKGALLLTRNTSKGVHKLFKAIVNELLKSLPILDESV